MSISPEEVLAQFDRQNHWDGVITTVSGAPLNLFDPDPEKIRSGDIQWGMSTACRFAGQTQPLVLVGEHSIMVMRIVEVMGWGDLTVRRQAFLHDAQEGYLYDLPATYRSHVYVLHPKLMKVIKWTEWEDMIARMIHDRFEVPFLEVNPAVRAADLIACHIEKLQIDSLSSKEDWGLPPIPSECFHLKYEFWDQKKTLAEVSRTWGELGLPLRG